MNEKGAYMPENEKRDKLINRVVKLFRLGDASRHSSEGELMAAVTKARELMALHNIEMVEVQGRLDESKAKELSIIVKEYTAYTRKGKFAKYDYSIMTAVSILTDTKVYMKNQGGYQSCMFVGDSADAHIASELYMVLLPSLRRFTRAECGKGWSQMHTDYALGFGARVVQRSQEKVKLNRKQQEYMALVVTKKNAVLRSYMNKLGLENTKGPTVRSSEHYNRGFTDGHKMDLGSDHRIK